MKVTSLMPGSIRVLFKATSCQWGSPSASDPRAKNTGQRATKGTVLTSQSLSPWCDCRRLGSTWASWRWQDINVGNPLRRRTLLPAVPFYWLLYLVVRDLPMQACYYIQYLLVLAGWPNRHVCSIL